MLAQEGTTGSIRGLVLDRDFDRPLGAAQVMAVELGKTTLTTPEGNYVLTELPPGKYTLVFSKEGYVRQVRSDVLVNAGQLTEVSLALAGDFTDMDEFIVQDMLAMPPGSDAALLQLRLESPSFVDSVSSELMSRAGASDAASALRLVAGASLQDGKSAVIRGLPDRYVSSQLNGVRLPTADEDKRAVELDQFPAAVISSIQVSKTFTPDQQGDASGGAVNLLLKDIPEAPFLQFSTQLSVNSQVAGSDFLTYDGGGVGGLGLDDGERDIQWDNLGGNWDGAVGVTEGDAPIDGKLSFATGGKHRLANDLQLGGMLALFYERDSSFFDNGKDDSYWVETPGGPMVPQVNQGTVPDGDFKTALFDVTRGSESVQWGGLGGLGLESENHSVGVTYLYSHTAEDTATLAEDTRGKEHFFPGYDPTDPTGPGNTPGTLNAAPYLRLETLEYTERTTDSLQFNGEHSLPLGFRLAGLDLGDPKLDWRLAFSNAGLYQPDKRQFGSLWLPASFNPGVPPFIPPFTTEPTHFPYKPGANFNLGNLQRIWKEIDEDSTQADVALTFPFDGPEESKGFLRTGYFTDSVDREFNQDSFSNFGDAGASFLGPWEEHWSKHFPNENHPITASDLDVDYEGEQDIDALYLMADVPLHRELHAIGGVRMESTQIGIVNFPEADALWFPPGSTAPVALNPGDADVEFDQDDLLPALGLVYTPSPPWTLRASYSRTVARQTFKELSPIVQQEYLGGPIFIGNPELGMSSIDNFDLRADFVPVQGSLLSASVFHKEIEDPIEYVQRVGLFTFTTATNYPEGHLSGIELEARQDLGRFAEALGGLSVGVNATFIDSEVTLPDDEVAAFALLGVPLSTRDMTDAPESLYNLYLTYDLVEWGTQLALFYTVQGDTLIAGAGQSNGNFVPSLYAEDHGTLNFSLSQRLWKHFNLQFQAKNLTNPRIETVYRSDVIGDDVTHTSYTNGIDFSLTFGASFTF